MQRKNARSHSQSLGKCLNGARPEVRKDIITRVQAESGGDDPAVARTVEVVIKVLGVLFLAEEIAEVGRLVKAYGHINRAITELRKDKSGGQSVSPLASDERTALLMLRDEIDRRLLGVHVNPKHQLFLDYTFDGESGFRAEQLSEAFLKSGDTSAADRLAAIRLLRDKGDEEQRLAIEAVRRRAETMNELEKLQAIDLLLRRSDDSNITYGCARIIARSMGIESDDQWFQLMDQIFGEEAVDSQNQHAIP